MTLVLSRLWEILNEYGWEKTTKLAFFRRVISVRQILITAIHSFVVSSCCMLIPVHPGLRLCSPSLLNCLVIVHLKY